MKIVIAIRDFHLPYKMAMRYAELAGIKLYAYQETYPADVKDLRQTIISPHDDTKNYTNEPIYTTKPCLTCDEMWNNVWDNFRLKRDDLLLVQVVEEFAGNKYLKVVEAKNGFAKSIELGVNVDIINKIKDFIQNLYCMIACVCFLIPRYWIMERWETWRFRIRVAKAIEGVESLDAWASELQVANSTIRRWANGVAVPFPPMRKIILEVLERK